jgi:hypothetical protein
MKINITSKTATRGTALLVTLFLCTILSVTIAGYLLHARQMNFISMRSQSWNLSIAASEAGIEEGMQHLNNTPTSLATDGWTQTGTSTYSVSRTLTATTGYAVTIDMTDPANPAVTSRAFINTPTLAMNGQAPIFAIGNANVATAQPVTVSRAVRITAGCSGLYLKAMVAKYTIDMNGNNVQTDSFNSNDPNHSNNGMYPAGNTSKLLDNGDVASNDTIQNSISVGNANIYGHVAVGPNGTIYVGSNGGVGARSWQANNTGIEPGYFTDDMNFTFPTETIPYTTGLTPQPATIYTTNYTVIGTTNVVTSSTYPSPVPASGVQSNVTYTTVNSVPSPVPYGLVTNVLTQPASDKNYPAASTYVGTPTLQGNKWYYNAITGYNYTYPTYTYTYSTTGYSTNFSVGSVTYDYVIQGGAANMPPVDYYVSSIPSGNILVKGNARLVVAGNFSLKGNNQLTVAPDGKLAMYVGGTQCNLDGNGVVNQTGYAQNFICNCTDSVTSMALNGNGQFTGILVAPNAAVQLNGGGNNIQDFIGCLIASSVKLNGHFNFHYDEALKSLNGGGRYLIKSWNEIPVTSANP